MLLKKGMIGPDVATLIGDLIKAGFAPNAGAGNNFNADVQAAVTAFQSKNIGPNLIPLVVDGEAGPLTRWALDVANGKTPVPSLPAQPALAALGKAAAGASTTGWNAIQVAIGEMNRGAGEKGGDNRGPDVMKYHGAAGGKAGWDWCAAFVSYCFVTGNPGAMPYKPTVGAQDTLSQFGKKGWAYTASLASPPAPGDIIVWWRGKVKSWEGHIGLVYAYENGLVKTIEGNRGAYPSKVRSFTYTLGQIDKLLGFGRARP